MANEKVVTLEQNDIMNLIGMVRNMATEYPQHKEYYTELERKLREGEQK